MVYKHFVPNGTEIEMPDDQTNTADGPFEPEIDQAELANSIIESLLEHTRVVSDLIAVMAQALDQDTTKALTQTPTWTAYLDSRRSLERTHANVEKFAGILKEMDPE